MSFRSALASRLPEPVARKLRAAKRSLVRDFIDEPELIAGMASARGGPSEGMLVDVGAHTGLVSTMFLDLGWSVVAYEPDTSNRKAFERRVGANGRVTLSSSAVSDKPSSSASFFTSSTSTGISTLAAFHDSHEPTAIVDVVTLAEDLRARSVERVDFLKIDIEGFDFFALKGFDWSYKPRFVLYEFEDRKTVPLGYSLSDSSAYVADRGYHLVYSVWEPIVEYGTLHRWRGLFRTPPPDAATCWGNVLCFGDEADAITCMKRFGTPTRRVLDQLRHG